MKVRCMSSLKNYQWFTVGAIYDVVDGNLIDDDGTKWDDITSVDKLNKQFNKFFVFEVVSDTPTKPTPEQLKALKPGDKVRLRSDRGSTWTEGMHRQYANKIVTVRSIDVTSNCLHIQEDVYFFNTEDIVEIISTTSTAPTKEQLMNLKVGDKVRIGEKKYPHWVSGMDKYRNQVVTINLIREDGQYFKIEEDRERWYFLLYKEWKGELQSDIVEIISDESPTPTETIPEKKEEPTVGQVTPEEFKEAVINFISKLPYNGGTVSFAICEAERARIIEGIRELEITPTNKTGRKTKKKV